MCIRDRISGNLIVNGFADGKPTSFTVDTGATAVSYTHLDVYKRQVYMKMSQNSIIEPYNNCELMSTI